MPTEVKFLRPMTPRLAVRLWEVITAYGSPSGLEIRTMLETHFDCSLLPSVSSWGVGELDRLEAIEAILKEWLAAFQMYRQTRILMHRDANARTKANEKPIPSARDLKPDRKPRTVYCKCSRFKIRPGYIDSVHCARCGGERRRKPTAKKRAGVKR